MLTGESLKARGKFTIVHRRAGEILETRSIDNVITVTGKALITSLLLTDVTGTACDAIAIGIGVTAADKAQTKLVSEITTFGGARRSGANVTGTQDTTTDADDTAKWVTTFTFTAGAGFAVTEAMVGNNAAADTGVMLCRQTFTAINVVSGDTLQITWKVSFA
jgi:hypothetical protein